MEATLVSLGLGGDGDEIDAIKEVERVFAVLLDYSEAASWRTVGDVYSALRSALSPEQREAEDVWLRFAQAISSETGVDPTRIGPETLLLAQGMGWLGYGVPIALAAAIAIVVAWRR